MADPWQILRDGGLPLAAPGTGTRPSERELAKAVAAAIETDPSGRDAEALAAFILAWRAHWPASFAYAHGTAASAVIAWGEANAIDPNRYLKLRRIALENLANVL
jgi:hypothetical protein